MGTRAHENGKLRGGKALRWIWGLGPALLAAAYLLCLLVPARVDAAPSTLARGANGEVWVVTPRDELVQMDDGGPVAYLLRSRVMGDVQSVTSQSGAVVAIDREGRLWGWRSGGVPSILAEKLPDEPTLLGQSICQASVGDSYVAAVTTEGGLLLLDGGGRAVPSMAGRQVKLCRVVGGKLYAVTADGVLYQLDGAGSPLYGAPARQIAAGVTDVNVAQGMTAQCLMEDGAVRLLAGGALGEPGYQGAAAVCVNALVNREGELLTWQPDGPGNETLILQRQDDNVAAAFSKTLYLRTNGRLHWDGMAFPVGVRTLTPLFRDLLFLWAAAGLLLTALSYFRKIRSRKIPP